jgi:hypothetical protein
MMVFHSAPVQSVGARSGWQRLQLMEYNSAPVSCRLALTFFALASGDAVFDATELVWPLVESVLADCLADCGSAEKTVKAIPIINAMAIRAAKIVGAGAFNCLDIFIFLPSLNLPLTLKIFAGLQSFILSQPQFSEARIFKRPSGFSPIFVIVCPFIVKGR